MAVIGTLAKARKIKWLLYMVLSIGFSLYCAYDGWFNEKYKVPEKSGDLWFNRIGAVVLAFLFIYLVVGYFFIRKTRIVADEKGLNINGKLMIEWPTMTAVDDSKVEKGLLEITYTHNGKERKYLLDNYKVNHYEEMLDEISLRRPDLLPPVETEPEEHGTEEKE
jgi:hypothetical protein